MSYYRYDGRPGFFSMLTPVVKNLIIINVIIMIGTSIIGESMYEKFSLFPFESPLFHPYQLVTHMFMHGGFWHILFNMYTLVGFGSVLERMIGEKKFLIFYFTCGLGAAALHLGVEYLQAHSFMASVAEGSQAAAQSYIQLKSPPTVGASGAIYGVLIGYAMLFPESKLTLIFPPVTLSAKWMVIIFVAIELVTGIGGNLVTFTDGIAHFAHLGGMLFAWLLIKYWKARGTLFNRENFS